MNQLSRRMLAVAVAAGFAACTAQSSQAGPWIDSIMGRRPPAYPVGTPVPVSGQTAYSPVAGYVPPSYAPYAGSQLGYGNYPQYATNNYYGVNQVAGYGNYVAPPTANASLLAPGFPQTVAGVLPTAAYDSQWNRVPVTYYRPVTAFDPRYGTTVTSLQPCTSYQYQAQRVPVIAPRPLLGDYGMQANKWPSITGPGYNPTGLVASPVYPVAQPYQGIPNSGVTYGQPSNFAPAASSGVSSGMPASTLPLNVFPNNSYNAPIAAAAPTYSNPGYASSLPANQIVGAAGTGVVPTAAWVSPGTSVGGNYAAGASGVAVPNIPGATVIPYGQPTYSSTPASPNTNGPYTNSQPAGSAPFVPGAVNRDVLPSQPVLPGADPDSMVKPFATQSSVAPKEKVTDGSQFPLFPAPREANTGNTAEARKPEESATLSLLQPRNALANNASTESQSIKDSTPIPSTLPASENHGVQPLFAPDDFDSKPKWNPTLLDPEDRVVLEKQGKLLETHEIASRRIQLQDEEGSAVSNAVAVAPSKPKGKVIQLASGNEPIKSDTATGANKSPFRPVTSPVTSNR